MYINIFEVFEQVNMFNFLCIFWDILIILIDKIVNFKNHGGIWNKFCQGSFVIQTEEISKDVIDEDFGAKD